MATVDAALGKLIETAFKMIFLWQQRIADAIDANRAEDLFRRKRTFPLLDYVAT
jgi:hypothetical protein